MRINKSFWPFMGYLVGFFLIPFIHELGHLVTGLLLGYHVTEIRIGIWLFTESHVDFYIENINPQALLVLFFSGMASTFLLGLFIGKGPFRGALGRMLRSDLLIYSVVGYFIDAGDYYGIHLLAGTSFAIVATFVALCSMGARQSGFNQGFSLLALMLLFFYPHSGFIPVIILFLSCLSLLLPRGTSPVEARPQHLYSLTCRSIAMTRENGQTKKTSRNYERERALDMCARMSAAEWDVIRAMPPSAKIASPDVEYWIRQGWVSRVDNWFMLTLAGKRARWSSATPTNAKDWIDVLTCIPGYGVLTRLLSEGIITNEGGFPMLSHFGRVVQQELRGGDIYFATRHTFLEG